VAKSIRTWGGNGYPPQDTGPLTDAERALLARRAELEHPQAGRGKWFPRDTEARHCVGMELTEWE
jgi:hypothetical protein